MKITAIRKKFVGMRDSMGIAPKKGVNYKKMDKDTLIKHIQTIEGNNSCYKSDIAPVCGQTDCLWYSDCTK